jgi:two-component system sensor histidine kinase YesM
MRLSVFSRIFLVFLAVISPLYVLSLYINLSEHNRIRHEIYTSTLNNIDLYVSNIESGIHIVITNAVSLINNKELQELSNYSVLSNPNVYLLINRIQRELTGLTENFKYIEDSYILLPLSGTKLTGRSFRLMDDFDYQCAANSVFYSGYPSGHPFINYKPNGGVYVNFSSESYMEHPSSEQVNYIIVTKIDIEKINKEFHQYFTVDIDEICFIGEANGLTIKNKASETVYAEIAAFSDGAEGDRGIEVLQLNSINRDMLVAYRKSPYLKTTFVLFAEEYKLLSILSAYRHGIWILTATMVILLIVFTLWTRVITNGMLRNQQIAIDKMYAQELLIKDTEYKMLQYQINPHFLYNTFFTMRLTLEAAEYDTLGQIISHLGSYFSFITKSDNFIPLEEEMKFCTDYLNIQSIRFAGRITADIENTPEDWKDRLIPRIIIQPLLENCFKHGLVNKEKDGRVILRFHRGGDSMLIQIEDNGDEFSDERLQEIQESLTQNKTAGTMGLRNVNQRLLSFFGDNYGLTVRRGSSGGLLAELRIPNRPVTG